MERRSWIKRWAWRLLPLLVLSVGGLGFLLLVSTRPELAQRDVVEKVWPVRAAPTVTTSIRPQLRFYGEVELRPLVSGRVVDVGPHFQNGGRVDAGELLVEIDRFEYEASAAEAAADLAEAKARLRELQTDLAAGKAMLEREKATENLRQRDAKRYADLQKRGAASIKSSDDAQMALLSATERVIERRFGIERLEANLARQAAVIQKLQVKERRAARDLSETRLSAPFAGYLTDIGIEVGKRVSQSDRAARLIDGSRLDVRFNIGMQQFGELLTTGELVGLPVEVVWSLQGNARRFAAVIERTGSEIDPSSGGVAVFARIESGEASRLLRPGAFVEVALPGPAYSGVVRLPETAWHDGHVMMVQDNRLLPREAVLVRRIGTDVLVRGAFGDDELALVTAIPGVQEGMRVTVVGEDRHGG